MDDSTNENAGRVNLVGIEFADFNEFFHFSHANFSAGRDHRIKISRGLSVNQIAGLVAFPCLHDRQLRGDPRLENVFAIAKVFRFLAFGKLRCETGARVKSRNSRAACAQSFSECALRNQFKLELAREDLPLEFLVLANVRRHHLFHLTRWKQNSHAEIVHARVVAYDCQSLHAAFVNRRDQVFRDAAQSKTAGGNRHVVVKKTFQRRLRIGINFVHLEKIVLVFDGRATSTIACSENFRRQIGRSISWPQKHLLINSRNTRAR